MVAREPQAASVMTRKMFKFEMSKQARNCRICIGEGGGGSINVWFIALVCLVCLVCTANNQIISDPKLVEQQQQQQDEEYGPKGEHIISSSNNNDQRQRQRQMPIFMTREEFCSKYPAECLSGHINWTQCASFMIAGTNDATCVPFAPLSLAAFGGDTTLPISAQLKQQRQQSQEPDGGLAPIGSTLASERQERKSGIDNEAANSLYIERLIKSLEDKGRQQSEHFVEWVAQQHQRRPTTTSTTTSGSLEESLGDQLAAAPAELSPTAGDLTSSGRPQPRTPGDDDDELLDTRQAAGGVFYGQLAKPKVSAGCTNEARGTASAGRQSARTDHELVTRAWRQRQRASTYRVSAEEAKRFIEAQQRGPNALSAISLSSLVVDGRGPVAARNLEASQAPAGPRGSVRLHRSESQALTTSELPPMVQLVSNQTLAGLLEPEVDADGGRRPGAAELRAGELAADSPMQCNMRRFTFKATKTDEAGNRCSGLITARICYGGCDTGEIADWLFPYKKSVHKVCRHGQRIRKLAHLEECSSENVEPSLREYYFVDAADCVCKKCTSVDTTCLGTMSRPHLQTLGEAVASMEQQLD